MSREDIALQDYISPWPPCRIKTAEEMDFDQMFCALTRIRDEAIDKNLGAAWAAGLAMLSIGTLRTRTRPPSPMELNP